MNFSNLMGSIGVSILLIAFVLNMMKMIKTGGLPYSLLNLAGASMACYASRLIAYFPFVILEGVWAVVSLTAVIKLLVVSCKR
jgi:hypothetical protein